MSAVWKWYGYEERRLDGKWKRSVMYSAEQERRGAAENVLEMIRSRPESYRKGSGVRRIEKERK